MKEERIISLDALRGLAAVAVAIPHFAMAEQFGVAIAEATAAMAVEVFFILSGFVLAPQILYCFEDNSVRRFEIFLARRWMRTLPLFALSLYVTAELHHQFNKHDFYEYLFFVRNFWQYKPLDDFFPVAWSLAIEEWFYVVFPCFLLTTKRLGLSWRYLIGIYLGLFLVVRAASAMLISDWNIGIHREVIFRLDSIGFGFLLFYLIKVSNGSRTVRVLSWIRGRLFFILLLSLLAITVYLYAYINTPSMMLSFFYFYVTAVFSMMILFYFHEYDDYFKFSTYLSNLSGFFGAISYSVYLFHYALIVIINHTLGTQGIAIRFIVFFVSLVGLSYFLRINFERPILRVRPRYNDLRGTVVPIDRKLHKKNNLSSER